jgi:hypothetical protein
MASREMSKRIANWLTFFLFTGLVTVALWGLL